MLTVIAGPNGSGKSTLITELCRQGVEIGSYFNADDIAKDLSGTRIDVAREAQEIVRAGRAQAMANGVSHSFETVMSHISHVEYMRAARAKGFEVRLFFVATDKPEINLQRVSNRVDHGGHDVPKDRIVSRYYRCLENLPAAITAANHSLIFDNSQAGQPHRLLAEISNNGLTHKVVRGYIQHRDRLRLESKPQAHLTLIPAWWLGILMQIKPHRTFQNGQLN